MTVVVIAIIVATATSASESLNVAARYAPLIKAIQQSVGADRSDLVLTLVNEITKDQ